MTVIIIIIIIIIVIIIIVIVTNIVMTMPANFVIEARDEFNLQFDLLWTRRRVRDVGRLWDDTGRSLHWLM